MVSRPRVVVRQVRQRPDQSPLPRDSGTYRDMRTPRDLHGRPQVELPMWKLRQLVDETDEIDDETCVLLREEFDGRHSLSHVTTVLELERD